MTRAKKNGKLPKEVEQQAEKDDKTFKKGNNISILKVSEPAVIKSTKRKIDSDSESELEFDILNSNVDNESEIEEIFESKIQPKSKKLSKEEKLIEEHLDQFKRHYDLKINNYFKQFNGNISRLENNFEKYFGENQKMLKKIMDEKTDRNLNDCVSNRNDSFLWPISPNLGYQKSQVSLKISDNSKQNIYPKKKFPQFQNQDDFEPEDEISNEMFTNKSTRNEKTKKIEYEKMLLLAKQASSIPNLATRLLLELFDEEELIGDVNVRGISMCGINQKRGLDPERIETIRKFCMDQAEAGTDKESLWRQCVNAMNKKISYLNQIFKN